MDKLEEYIWGRVDQEQFLCDLVAGGQRMDTERMMNRVQAVQGELNSRLRQGVEENYPHLLEQVTAIERLDSAHSHFRHEVEGATQKADNLAKQLDRQAKQLRSDVLSISNLTKISRLLEDALRCENLTSAWREEKDLIRRAELITELNSVVKGNDKLKQLKWLQERCLFKRDEMVSRTRQDLLEQLRTSLRSHNALVVRATLKALQNILDNHNAFQREIASLMDEAIRELDALFLQLGAQASQERCARLLPPLGTKLHDQLEQFQLLGNESAQQFARQIGKVISNRVPPNASYSMRLVQTIYKCLMSHPDSVANTIRDALNPLKASILSQSLSRLFSIIDDTFQMDDRRDAIIVEKLNASFRAELASVGWDKSLQQEMEANIAKALQYVAVKLEQQLQFGEDALRFIGRISKAQTQNYQLLNIAHELARHWPGFCAPLQGVIQPALHTILDQMRSTVSLVLASMHDENMLSPLPAGVSSSEYVKELCAHLKVFRQHCVQLKPLTDSLEALPSFLNFCIEQFLLNISLIRPLKAESIDRFVRDLEYLCKNGLQPFNSKYAKLLNSYRQIQEFIQSLPDKCFAEVQQLTGMEQPEHKQPNAMLNPNASSAVPQWFIAHMLICSSDAELHLPHDSAGWSIPDYVRWFNQHSDLERWRFLQGLLEAYKKSVVARAGTQFVRQFPVLSQLVSDNLQTMAA